MNYKIFLQSTIENLGIDYKTIKKLKENKINNIQDLWILKRKDLKDLDFNDNEIKQIVICLQLNGLDLNMKRY